MKYDIKIFNKEVADYKKALKGKIEKKVMFIEIELENKNAFFSLAPLSRAVHDMGGELHITVKNGKSEGIRILKDIWKVYNDKKKKIDSKEVKALNAFIESVNKRTKSKKFEKIFKEPEFILKSEKKGFKGTIELKYNCKWFKKYKWNQLLKTAEAIWKQGYNLKKKDIASIGFVTVPSKENTELPLEDYLDSYSIAMSMAEYAVKTGAKVSLGSSTDKFSVLAQPVRTTDLSATIRGCELVKEINEEVFQKFKVLSGLLKINKMKFPTAGFGIHAKGRHGKHFFGEEIGYPTLNKKSRWSSPGQIMLKDRHSPQGQIEPRDPIMRYAMTESLPLDLFIKTCNVNYTDIRNRSKKIKNILDKCEYVRVIGQKQSSYKTDFTVELTGKKGRRDFTAQDSDVRTIVDQEHYKKTKIKCGAYANFPSGEAFTTPETLEGTVVGDVVISINRSMRIPKNQPVIIKIDKKKGYKIIKAPKEIHEAMKKEWAECKKRIKNLEKSGSVPKKLTDMYKENFWRIGEFAINTNPKAELCDYLIVNEKIARMIHIAMGMGFAPDRATVYHWDIVIDSPRQKLDIFGVDKTGKEHWVIKKGKFVA